jgi:hypothetical protein
VSKRIQLPMPTAESVAREFHDVYERLSPLMGYVTNDASRKPWPEVPERNRILMQATALHVLAYVEKYILGSLEIGSLLHRDTIPLHAIGDVVDHYRAGLPVSDVADRLHATIMWLAKVGGGVPAMPYPPLTAAPRFVEAADTADWRARAEAAEAQLAEMTEWRDNWRLKTQLERERAEAAEAKWASVPWELIDCAYQFMVGEGFEDDELGAWLNDNAPEVQP